MCVCVCVCVSVYVCVSAEVYNNVICHLEVGLGNRFCRVYFSRDSAYKSTNTPTAPVGGQFEGTYGELSAGQFER